MSNTTLPVLIEQQRQVLLTQIRAGEHLVPILRPVYEYKPVELGEGRLQNEAIVDYETVGWKIGPIAPKVERVWGVSNRPEGNW